MKKVLTITGNNKYAQISRSLLSDGYNYYITVFIKGLGGHYFINDNIKQVDSILTLKKAHERAIEFLNSINY